MNGFHLLQPNFMDTIFKTFSSRIRLRGRGIEGMLTEVEERGQVCYFSEGNNPGGISWFWHEISSNKWFKRFSHAAS